MRLCGCLISRLSITFDTFLLLLMFVICYAGITLVNILARRHLYGLFCSDCRFVSYVGLEWLFCFLQRLACSFFVDQCHLLYGVQVGTTAVVYVHRMFV